MATYTRAARARHPGVIQAADIHLPLLEMLAVQAAEPDGVVVTVVAAPVVVAPRAAVLVGEATARVV